MRNKKDRYERRNFRKRRKSKEPKETRADVLEALEQQRKHAAESHESGDHASTPKQIPGFFFDQEKQKYFPISMKRDAVYVGSVCHFLKVGQTAFHSEFWIFLRKDFRFIGFHDFAVQALVESIYLFQSLQITFAFPSQRISGSFSS